MIVRAGHLVAVDSDGKVHPVKPAPRVFGFALERADRTVIARFKCESVGFREAMTRTTKALDGLRGSIELMVDAPGGQLAEHPPLMRWSLYRKGKLR